MRINLIAAGIAVMLAAGGAFGHGASHDKGKAPQPMAGHEMSEETAYGRAGDPKKVSRTVTVDMSDKFRFNPSEITLKRGDTVRFVVKNSGQLLHEMVLGTMSDLKKHSELMKKFPGMEHDEPNMTHVEPGEKGEVVWQFTKAGNFNFACLIPGHFEAGMIGSVRVADAREAK